MEISLSFPFEGKIENFARHSNPHSGNSRFIVAGDILLFGFLGRRGSNVPIHARQSFFPFFLFYPFFSLLYCITMLLPPTLPSWAWLSSSAYCAAFPLLCHSLVCSGSSKVKSTETLISEALAHSALEIRILVHYTQLLAEQSSVTRKHNAGARGSDLEL